MSFFVTKLLSHFIQTLLILIHVYMLNRTLNFVYLFLGRFGKMQTLQRSRVINLCHNTRKDDILKKRKGPFMSPNVTMSRGKYLFHKTFYEWIITCSCQRYNRESEHFFQGETNQSNVETKETNGGNNLLIIKDFRQRYFVVYM